ncbi:hypothetical protein [Specibacter sp. NPDC078692]|uniref:hypothetical protein n=1 Tax=Specibacter sp. NPDC078692 TaxID=3155818 RepID=UPI00341A279F
MEALWIATALVVAVMGGWPVTAGMLKLARSKTVRAADAAEATRGERTETDGLALTRTETPASEAIEVEVEVEAVEAEAQPAPPAPKTEVLRGGLLIGCLERAAVAVAILAGQPVAIAYVVAIKGLGRYPELKDTPAASERFIIGTLASMLWAASVAVLAKALLL